MIGCHVREGMKPSVKSLPASVVTRRWRGSQSAVGVCQSDMGVRSTHRLTHAHIHFAKAACVWRAGEKEGVLVGLCDHEVRLRSASMVSGVVDHQTG